MLTLSLDVGATKTHLGLLDGFQVRREETYLTHAKRPKHEVLKSLLENTRKFLGADWKKLAALNCAWAGEVEPIKGLIRSASNFSDFNNVEIVKIFRNEFRKPATIENDAKCFTLAESVLGKGKNYSFVLGLTVGTGIGAALVIDKKLLRGRDNLAGEAGHIMIASSWPKELPARRCGCPVGRHWEAFSSGPAWQVLAKNYNSQRADEIVARNLGRGVASLITLFNPQVVIIGGGLLARSSLFNKLRKEVKNYLPYEVLKSTLITKPLLGMRAILVGAKLAGRNI